MEIVFISSDGMERRVAANEGMSVMSTATSNGVAGIIGECGGNAMCATCHIYVSDERLPPLSEEEDELLDGTAEDRTSESRLSCQIILTAALDGLRVRLPEHQI